MTVAALHQAAWRSRRREDVEIAEVGENAPRPVSSASRLEFRRSWPPIRKIILAEIGWRGTIVRTAVAETMAQRARLARPPGTNSQVSHADRTAMIGVAG